MYLLSYDFSNSGKIVYSKQYLTRGGKIFFAFLLLEYIFPLLLNLLFDTEPIFRLPIHSLKNLFYTLIIISSSIFAVFISKYTPTITPKNKNPIKPVPKWFITMFSLIAIVLGLIIFINDLSQWRYSTSLSDNNLIIFASIIQTMMIFFIFWVLMTDQSFILSHSMSDIIKKVIIFFATIFSINGLGSIFIVLIAGLFVFSPKSAMAIFYGNFKNVSLRKILRTIIVISLFIVIFIPISKLALYAKSGNSSFKTITSIYLDFNYLINRHSVHLSNLVASIEDEPDLSNLKVPFKIAIYRIKILTGIDPYVKKPEIGSFARISLLQFANFDNINPKGGSSPGLLASMTMVFSLPVSIFSVFFITFFFIKIIDFILCRQQPFNWLGAFIFSYMPLRYFTDSPLDLFIPGEITILILVLLILSFRRERIN